jgi:hypothetical protein
MPTITSDVNSCPLKASGSISAKGPFHGGPSFLKCSTGTVRSEIETGLCIDGKCKDQSLEPIALAVVDGDVCICGIALVEDDRMLHPFDEFDDTMEIMIHPD